eukprot:9231089-Pyramimonas_sp.AAC.1
MCIHKGDGLELAKFEAHIRSAFTRWRHDDRKQTKAMLTKGEVVLRFTFVTVRAPIEDLPDVELFSDGPLPAAGVDHEHRWFHVAFHYSKPFGPTFVELMRDPSRDDSEALGVTPLRAHEPTDLFRSLWEMVKSFMPKSSMTVSFWQFLGRPKRIHLIEPWKLYVKKLSDEFGP